MTSRPRLVTPAVIAVLVLACDGGAGSGQTTAAQPASTTASKTASKTAAATPSDETPAPDPEAVVAVALPETAIATPSEPPADILSTTAPSSSEWDCTPGSREGVAGETKGMKTPGGLAFNVITPSDYIATAAHPLLIMHPGAGETPDSFATQTGATDDAISAGYIIVYAGHVSPVDADRVLDAATIAGEVTERWCVDAERVFLAGNSDGASTIALNVIGDHIRPRPRAIMLNAVGTSRAFLDAQRCARPLSTLIVHGSADTLFRIPSYGIEVSDWWAECNECGTSAPTAEPGCRDYSGCSADLAVEYCEVDLPHGRWPTLAPGFEGFNLHMLTFFGAHGATG